MTALTTRPGTATGRSENSRRSSSDRRPSRGGRPTPHRRNNGRIAAGVLLLVLSVLGAIVLFSSATNRVAVIGLARDVPVGHAITQADLREVSISGGSGLNTIPADRASRVVGRIAGVGLTAGSLLTDGQLSNGPSLPAGNVITGAVLKAGQYPVGLAIGDLVEVVETTAPDATGAGQPLSRGQGTVLDLHESADGQSLLTISLAVPAKDSAAISSAGADGRLSVVVTAP